MFMLLKHLLVVWGPKSPNSLLSPPSQKKKKIPDYATDLQHAASDYNIINRGCSWRDNYIIVSWRTRICISIAEY